MTALHRRSFITGLVSLVAAPAIVRAGSLMPVKVMIEPYGIGPMMQAMQCAGIDLSPGALNIVPPHLYRDWIFPDGFTPIGRFRR